MAIGTLIPLVVPANAEKVCVEEAAGVCLKYREVAPAKPVAPKPAAPSAPAFPSSAEAQAEKRLSLNRNEYRLVQAGLEKSGHYSGALDGVMGDGSRKALAAWQAANGASATGYLTFEQALALQGHKAPAAPAVAAPASQPEQPAASEHPVMGRVYEKTWAHTGGSTAGDVITSVQRISETHALLKVQLLAVNNVAFGFKGQCEIPISGKFTCVFPRRTGRPWRASGELPEISTGRKTFSFW